jgi:nucleotide-binding universal stress UspA family protein
MQSLSRLLFPIDFSERSLGAARYARLLAAHYHSEVVLLHVVTPPQYEFGALEIGGSMLTELYTARTAQMEKDLHEFAAGELAGLNVRPVLLEGDPARRIVQFAHDEQVGLIVMPTHGYGSFRRFILGSITAKVLHDANCPVWTGVHLEEPPLADASELGHIVCGVDLGILTTRTLAWATALQRRFGSRLTVVHVPTSQPEQGDGPEPGWRAALEARVREFLAAVTAEGPCPVEVAIEPGDPPKVVCGAAARLHAGLLVIGRGSAAGVFGRLRTNAYAIIRQSPCPVLSV